MDLYRCRYNAKSEMRYRIDSEEIWLGDRDSNPDTQLQRLQSYR